MSAAERDAAKAETYLNPVHARDFPDPFVLKFAGEYFAYCTGLRRDGRAFGVMRSRDLVRWEDLAGALAPLPGEYPCYWAPEVTYRDGKFLMYYSVGNETLMHVRVAVAGDPAGPFVDSGHRLTNEEFAIDPHVFTDADGTRYLFYATDFLDHSHVGTGTVVDRMIDDFTLEGRPRPVTRARYDWQVYDPAREGKGGVRWHTVEGPFVLERKGLYYEMFSGGNWQNVSYGVSYATSDRVIRDEEWEQHADGEKVLPVLRTIPEKVLGPGHNSVVRAPDNQQLFCVYHRWAEEGRVLAIDRMEFVGDALKVLGPTTTPQPAPYAPWFADYFDVERDGELGEGWQCASGRWSVREREARQEATEGTAEARCEVSARSFIAEVNLRSLVGSSGGAFGVRVEVGDGRSVRFAITPESRAVSLETGARVGRSREWEWSRAWAQPLAEEFDSRVPHLLRVEVDGGHLRFALDDITICAWQLADVEAGLDATARLSLYTVTHAAAFGGFMLTRGFADEFDDEAESRARGWNFGDARRVDESCEAKFAGRRLRLSRGETAGRANDILFADSYELVISLKLDADESISDAGSSVNGGREYVLSPGASLPSGAPLNFELRGGAGGWVLSCEDEGGRRSFSLPESFAPREFHQFRFRRVRDSLIVQVGAEIVCELGAAGACGSIGVAAGASPVVLDSVRLTAIRSS